jgi:hypothetical protein
MKHGPACTCTGCRLRAKTLAVTHTPPCKCPRCTTITWATMAQDEKQFLFSEEELLRLLTDLEKETQ